MEYYYITGTSQGLGNALAKLLLDLPNAHITGISRNNTISHERYRHIHLDLSDISKLKTTAKNIFQNHPDGGRIILINNAGVLGPIGHIGATENDELQYVINVNVTAPMILMNEFIKKYHDCTLCDKLILNISSGAGKKPTDGWGGYCASKAALDMFSEVVAVEKQKEHHKLKIFSVAPGIVDTPMQDQIRAQQKENFSRVDEFIEYKKENMLMSPEKVAKKLLYIIENEDLFHEPLLSVRNIK